MNILSSLIIPLLAVAILIIGVYKKVDCFQVFKKGAGEGLLTIVKLVPTYIGLFAAVSVFRASGAIEGLIDFLSPIFNVPELISETAPLMVMRPVSGSAALAVLENIIKETGADSKISLAACIMMGSTETVFYTMSVYTNDTDIKSMPGVLSSSLIANVVSCILALIWVINI